MLRKEYAGRFHSDRVFSGRREALHEWRVTTNSRDVAQVAARRLGGEVRGIEDSPHSRWEVLTETPIVEVLVEDVTSEGISFMLAEEIEVGKFFFSSNMWNPQEIIKMSVNGDSPSVPCRLKLESVEFKTRTGLTILYILPSLQLTSRDVRC
ncbi:hypothetical protein [Streptomyces sp. NPDC091383]|uniref:hypothetical protein n=1 Tax=Streptomyces sp. NPDC091383 TaxID=3365996 RepID=UPI003813264A